MHHLLIIGCGSIGERHLRCFQKTQRCTVAACDSNAALLEGITTRYGVKGYATLDQALAEGGFTAAVICTPAHLHLPMAATLLTAGLDLLIEKPLSTTLDQVEAVRQQIAETQRKVAVAYVYHVMPWILGAREFLQRGTLGKISQASVVAGQHFPTYRPAYRDIYYARHEHGGGAIQDALTHVVNAMEWLIGPCTRVFCDAAHQVLEGVTVEDTVTVSARHGEVLVSYALNQFQAPNETFLTIHGEQGSVKIEPHLQRWGVLMRGESDWTWHKAAPLERDDLFIAQAQAFLDSLEGKASPLSTYDEAAQTLKFNHAALASARTGMPIILS